MQKTHIFDFIQCFSDALDLIVPDLSGHHKRVAYIGRAIAAALGLSEDRQYVLLTAGMLHDAGALTLKSRMDALQFETGETSHAETGYRLLRSWPALTGAAEIIRGHHARYDARGNGCGEYCEEAYILHLADRVDALLRRGEFVLDQAPRVCREMKRRKGTQFDPAHVEAFLSLADKEYFWLDITADNLRDILGRVSRALCDGGAPPAIEEIEDFTRLFTHVIDFRSRFTATHSAGVSATAAMLGEIAGFDPSKARRLRIAGYLHDLGKLAVPAELLDKQGPLTPAEFNRIKSHAYHTHRLLLELPGMDDIRIWAASHHETPTGQGYPFHFKDDQLPLGARVMSAADVFTALSEDRPYRAGMEKKEAAGVLQTMAAEGRLDPRIMDMLFDAYDALDAVRRTAQQDALSAYAIFQGRNAPGENALGG